MSHPSAVAAPAAPARVAAAGVLSTETRVAYGASAFAENLAYNSIVQLANPIFNLILGVNPALIGAALALPRLLDVVVDPWVGSASDNLRSRWGRRRPFIAVGAILTGLCAAGVWFFPLGQSPTFYFWWLVGASFLMATAYSLFVVPYGALGLELTSGYHERTRLMAVKSALHKTSGIVNQWLLRIVELGVFAGAIVGSRVCGVAIGFIVAGLGLWTVLRVREPHDFAAVPRRRIRLWGTWRETLRQSDFRRIVFAQVCIYASVLLVDTVGFYLNVFYVNGGHIKYAALLKGASGTAFQVGGLLCIPLITRLSGRFGKQRAFLLCTASIVAAGIAKWFCYVPGAGWWLVLPSLLLAPGLVAVMVMVPSMTADICDLDEAANGSRREGMFNATAGWLLKLSMSGAAFGAGALLVLCGWHTELAVNQSPSTYLAMRIAFSLGTVVLAVLAAVFIRRYAVPEQRVLEARARLAQPSSP